MSLKDFKGLYKLYTHKKQRQLKWLSAVSLWRLLQKKALRGEARTIWKKGVSKFWEVVLECFWWIDTCQFSQLMLRMHLYSSLHCRMHKCGAFSLLHNAALGGGIMSEKGRKNLTNASAKAAEERPVCTLHRGWRLLDEGPTLGMRRYEHKLQPGHGQTMMCSSWISWNLEHLKCSWPVCGSLHAAYDSRFKA